MNIGDLISNKDWATAYLMLNNYDGEKEISDAEMSKIMRQYLNDLGLSKERIDSLMSVAESKPLVSGLFDINNSETTASEEFVEQLSNIEDLYIEEFFDCDMTKYNIGGNVLNLLKLGYNMTNIDEGSLKYKVDEVDTALEALDLLNNIIGSTPHGVLYSEALSEFIPNLEISLKLMIKNFTRTEITYEVLLENKNYGIEYKPGFNNWLAGMSPLLNDDAVYEKWANGPDLKTLEQIYTQYPDFASKYMNDYLVWRVNYEANLKYYEDIKNIFGELTSEEEKNIAAFGEKYNNISNQNEDNTDPLSDNEDIPDDLNKKAKEILTEATKMLKYIDLGIPMVDAIRNTLIQINTASKTKVDPLILDLDGDGYNIETKENGSYFDLDGNGYAERINWTKKDGFLCLDLNENGSIDSGAELFGDNTLLADGSLAKNGFEALAQYDSNNDGIIDANDSIFGNLRVWVDGDGNGESGEG